MITPLSGATPRQIRSYMSDMLSELADLAKGLSDSRLECSIRLLALDVVAAKPAGEPTEPRQA